MDTGSKKHFTIGPYASNEDSSSKEDLSTSNSLIKVRNRYSNNSLRSNPSFTNIVIGQSEQSTNGPIATITTGYRSGSWHDFADYTRSNATPDATKNARDFTSTQVR